MLNKRSLIAATLVLAALGCRNGDVAPAPDDQAPAIGGELIDELLETQFPSMGLPRPIWSSMERFDQDRRLVVHVRIPEDPDLERSERYRERCLAAQTVVTEKLAPGQRFELYLVFDSTVRACR